MRVQGYLDAYYLWRKAREPSFSYTSWATELGLRSRVFLKLMVAGKRSITEKSVPLFIHGLQLDGPEANYFTALTRLDRAETAAERESQLAELCRYGRKRSRPQPILDRCKFLSSSLAMRLQAFLTFQREEPWRPDELARYLDVREGEVQGVLRTLKSLGLAIQEKSEGWRATCKTFEIEDDLGNVALQALHRKCLEDAIRSIELDPSQRSLQNLVVFLTSEELLEFESKIREFVASSLERFSNRKPPGARLHQAHFSLIPVSGPILQAESDSPAPVSPHLSPSPMEKP